jgi:hypothetical protein
LYFSQSAGVDDADVCDVDVGRARTANGPAERGDEVRMRATGGLQIEREREYALHSRTEDRRGNRETYK